jgi:hypothetical protein
MKFLGRLTGGLFGVVSVLAGLWLVSDYWQIWTDWLLGIFGAWGFFGAWLAYSLAAIIAFATAPSIVVFPLIYWFAEGAFPTFYFELLGVCVGSSLIGGLLWWAGGDSN